MCPGNGEFKRDFSQKESSSNGMILLVDALEHEFYDFPYIGNNNPN